MCSSDLPVVGLLMRTSLLALAAACAPADPEPDAPGWISGLEVLPNGNWLQASAADLTGNPTQELGESLWLDSRRRTCDEERGNDPTLGGEPSRGACIHEAADYSAAAADGGALLVETVELFLVQGNGATAPATPGSYVQMDPGEGIGFYGYVNRFEVEAQLVLDTLDCDTADPWASVPLSRDPSTLWYTESGTLTLTATETGFAYVLEDVVFEASYDTIAEPITVNGEGRFDLCEVLYPATWFTETGY